MVDRYIELLDEPSFTKDQATKKVIKYYDEHLKSDPTDILYNELKIIGVLKFGSKAKAIEALHFFVKSANDAEAWLFAGEVFLWLGRKKEAIIALDTSFKFNPNHESGLALELKKKC
ncbi:MAG: hypothetical protein ABII22_05330 [Candidatus Micrarchaeota archaeon]